MVFDLFFYCVTVKTIYDRVVSVGQLSFGCRSYRGSPIGFSGSGIWLISRPRFGILKEKGDEIRDCNYDRDTGFGDFNRRESGNVALKKARFVNSRD